LLLLCLDCSQKQFDMKFERVKDMLEWWASLGITMQIFYCIAIPATLIIVIQTILLMIGIGHGGTGVEFSDTSGIDGLDISDVSDIPTDAPDIAGAHAIDGCDHTAIGDGSNPSDFGTMQLFTLQGIMTFLCVFGWTGIICTSLGLHVAIAIIIALVLGFLAMLGVAKVLQLTKKLTQDGSLDVRRLLGEKGRVYIPIPANESGEGKVTVAAGERFIELSAVTDEQETIPTGTQVRIIDVRGDVVAVEKDK
jgi:membrane protein implicated in regulation of membrane protease activity